MAHLEKDKHCGVLELLYGQKLQVSVPYTPISLFPSQCTDLTSWGLH